MTSEFILLYKDTSLLAAVGVMELMLYSKSIVAVTGNMTPYIVAACFYLVVTLPLIRVVTILEKRLASTDGGMQSRVEKKAHRRFLNRKAEPTQESVPQAGVAEAATQAGVVQTAPQVSATDVETQMSATGIATNKETAQGAKGGRDE